MSVQLQSLNSGQNLPQTPSQDDVFNQRFSQDSFDFDINSSAVNESKMHDQSKPFKTPGQPQISHQFVGQTTPGYLKCFVIRIVKIFNIKNPIYFV